MELSISAVAGRSTWPYENKNLINWRSLLSISSQVTSESCHRFWSYHLLWRLNDLRLHSSGEKKSKGMVYCFYGLIFLIWTARNPTQNQTKAMKEYCNLMEGCPKGSKALSVVLLIQLREGNFIPFKTRVHCIPEPICTKQNRDAHSTLILSPTPTNLFVPCTILA